MNKRLRIFYALIAVVIAGLIFFVHYYPTSSFDIYVTREIQEHRNWDLTLLMRSISFLGDPGIAPLSIILASLFFFLTYHRREALFSLAVVLPDLSNILIKILIRRPRPTLENARILLKFTQSGFPSGHVVHYVVFFGFLLAVMVLKKDISMFWRILVGTLSTFLILTVSISRIFLGAHWATDVLGGYLFGFVYLGIILKFYLNR